MNHDSKREKWQVFAKDNHIQPIVSEKVLEFLGFRVRPFLFWNPLICFIHYFLVFGCLSATSCFIFSSRNVNLKKDVILSFILSGALAGGLVSLRRQYKLRKSLKLKSWDEF